MHGLYPMGSANNKIFKIFKIQFFDTLYEFEKMILQRSLWGKI
jgi:hypothetical protein